MHTVEWKPKMIYSCLMREIARFNFPMCVFSCHIVVNFGLIVRFVQVVFRPFDVFHGSCHHGLSRASLRSSASLRSCACRSSSALWRCAKRAKKAASLSGCWLVFTISSVVFQTFQPSAWLALPFHYSPAFQAARTSGSSVWRELLLIPCHWYQARRILDSEAVGFFERRIFLPGVSAPLLE